MSSVTVCNCPQNTLDLACLQAMSSRPSDQQQKKPTAVCAEPVVWNGDLMAAGWTQALAESSVRNWCAVVGQIPRSLVVLASVHEHTELILDSFWNVKPIELGVHETRQTVVEVSGVTDNARGCVQHSLQPVLSLIHIWRCRRRG